MVQSLELLLDPESDAAVRRDWNYLAELGLPSQARHTGASNRPHVTVAVASAFDVGTEDRLVELVTTDDAVPGTLRLGGLMVFGGARVTLARAVVPSAELLEFHARVHDRLGDSPGVPPHLLPGRWTPHVTLAMRGKPHEIGSAATALSPGLHDLDAAVAGVRRWDGDAKQEWLLGDGQNR
ncbi:2'-5' RNA ligase family protein [Rhodococcoides kroppenstedtii]|uniref:2'-5' RNA ligase family protein n=1 Tax=Rhodococcoides kroppenstedtii TaxID=293050 RepID=UPI0028F12F4B|nr:2'-5' RNA ligase family protein [Rhodococcus kroppenstedtii]